MEQSIAELLKECMQLESESKTLVAMLIFLDPPPDVRKYFVGKFSRYKVKCEKMLRKWAGEMKL